MTEESEGMNEVRFLPDDVTARAPPGATVLNIARDAGVSIYSPCGGQGICGRCAVRVEGEFETGPSGKGRFGPGSGKVLACQCIPVGDVTVTVPDSSRPGKAQILTESRESVFEVDPSVRKVYLELPPPSISDNVCDLLRLSRELGYGKADVRVRLELLRELGETLREGDWKITATVCEGGRTPRIVMVEKGDTTRRSFGLAVDVGTTTIAGKLFSQTDGEVLATAARANAQIPYGEDVISRINFSKEDEEGLATLRKAVMSTIGEIVEEVCGESDVEPREIMAASMAGNSTMIHLLLEISPATIQLEPYIPTICTLEYLTARSFDMPIHPSGGVYLLPGRAGFVGGDITADVLACGMHKRGETALMIDVGTNGEVVLGNKDWLMACSCSAGPAFEGGEVEHGMRAEHGAIETVEIDDELNLTYETIGEAAPRGICGTGLIDLIAELFYHGFIDRAGTLLSKGCDEIVCLEDREEGYGNAFIVVPAEESDTGKAIFISEADIKNILRTKAAMYAACAILVNNAGLTFADIERVYISGGFGRYLDSWKCRLLGLLPDIEDWRFDYIGNGALQGARLALLSKELRGEAREVFENMTYLELSVRQEFMDEFSSARFIPHTDLSLFPTVQKTLAEREPGTYIEEEK